MQKIVIVNSKGGSGKTTVAVNVAASFAHRDFKPALMDLDPQGSSMRWLQARPESAPVIHGIAGYESRGAATRSWQLQPPPGCNPLIIDSPAGLDSRGLAAVTRGADAILIPVLPSEIDIHAAVQCIANLLLSARSNNTQQKIAIIANRVKANTLGYKKLESFLRSLEIPVLATLRDSQSFTRSAGAGIGIDEMPAWQVRKDLEPWQVLMTWLEERVENGAERRLGGLRSGMGRVALFPTGPAISAKSKR